MKIAVLGFGREGRSLFRFLRRDRAHRGAELWILDRAASTVVPRGVKAQLGPRYLKNLSRFDLIFRSPGIPRSLPELQKAHRAGARLSSPTELFFERCQAAIVGITGTKGKGTMATLLYRMLVAAKKSAVLAGNIGVPALDTLSRIRRGTIVILELSSFQLQDLRTSPHIAVVLDIFPDHQDVHQNLREYYEAKANIARHQRPGDIVFSFKNDAGSARIGAQSRGRKIAVDEGRFSPFGPDNLHIRGTHNFRNAVMAATVAATLGVPKAAILRAAKRFRGNEHRLELVRTLHAVTFYNDSASTNPQTAAAAIRSFPGAPKVLIAGGYDKGLDYAPLARALRSVRREMTAVVLFGANREKVRRAISATGVHIAAAPNLRAAVRTAFRAAKRSSPSVVLFSPGAASFDMFTSYAHRGLAFKRLARGLTR